MSLRVQAREALLAFAGAMALGFVPVGWNETVGQIPSIYWTAAGAIAMLVVVIVSRADRRVDMTVMLVTLAYLATYAVGTLISYAFTGESKVEREELLYFNWGILSLGVVYFFFGAQVGADRRWGGNLGLLIAWLAIVAHALIRRDTLTTGTTISLLNSEGLQVGYQQLGDSFVMCTLALMARIRQMNVGRRIPLLLVFAGFSIVVLFIIPSRSAAIFGAGAIVIALVMLTPPKVRWMMALGLLCLGLVVKQLPIWSLADGTRYASLVAEDGEDTSEVKREQIMHEGWDAIKTDPILGHWAFQLERFGESGAYIHNAMDIWVQAGIIPFLTFLGLCGLIVWKWVVGYRLDPDRSVETLSMLIFALSSWCVSRSAAYVLLLFCLGYAMALKPGETQVFPSFGRRSPMRRRA